MLRNDRKTGNIHRTGDKGVRYSRNRRRIIYKPRFSQFHTAFFNHADNLGNSNHRKHHQENDKNNQTGEKLRHHIMLHLYPDPHPSLHFQYINL